MKYKSLGKPSFESNLTEIEKNSSKPMQKSRIDDNPKFTGKESLHQQ